MKRSHMALLSVTFLLAACQPADREAHLGSGKVVSVGQEHLIVQNESKLMFVQVDATTKQSLSSLKQGDAISLWGTNEVVSSGSGSASSSDVHSIVKADGTRIGLR